MVQVMLTEEGNASGWEWWEAAVAGIHSVFSHPNTCRPDPSYLLNNERLMLLPAKLSPEP